MLRTLATRPAVEALRLELHRSAPFALGLMAIVALWLLGRRYKGITHDAALYFAQALRRLDPERFTADVFFAFHSQDGYSLFPALYAPLLDALGTGAAAATVTLAGQAAFMAAAWLLARRLLGTELRWWSLALLACLSGYYGGLGVFRLAEPFATARTFAEPLAVTALALTLAGRPWIAATALAGSALLHPLVAAPAAAAVALFYATGRLRVPMAAAILLAAGTLAVLVARSPTLDAAWLEPLLERSPHLFMANWAPADWARVVWGMCIARLALNFLAAAARRMVAAIAATALAGLLSSAVAVDGMHSALAAALQMWRAHWLLHLLAILLVPLVVVRLWRGERASQLAAACVAASCCFGRDELPVAGLLAVASLLLARHAHPAWLTDAAHRGALVLLAAAASVGLLLDAQAHAPPVYGATMPPSWLDHLVTAGTLLPMALLLWLALHSAWLAAASGLLALVAVALGAFAWDSRSEWSRMAEGGGKEIARFRAAVAPSAQVFWPGQSSPAWLVLHRPNWHSGDQGAGIVFSRDTALVYHARRQASAALTAGMAGCQFADAGGCRISADLVRALCAEPSPPAHVVLDAPLDDGTSPSASLRAGRRTFHLFDC